MSQNTPNKTGICSKKWNLELVSDSKLSKKSK